MRNAFCILFLTVFISRILVAQAPAVSSFERLPLGFVQISDASESNAYVTQIRNIRMIYQPQKIVFYIQTIQDAPSLNKQPSHPFIRSIADIHQPVHGIRMKQHSLQMQLVGANPSAEMKGENQLPYYSNYFIGHDPVKWRRNVPNYARIRFQEIYDGVDLIYHGNRTRLKYDFIIRAGHDPDQILLKYQGAEALQVNPKGELEIHTGAGLILEKKPVVYQVVEGKQVNIEADFQVQDKTVRFHLGKYQSGLDLYIDPEIVYAAVIGGNNDESVSSSALDSEGNIYVCGSTYSSDLPVTPSAYDTVYNAYPDGFIYSLDPSGTQIRYMTYIGNGIGYGSGINDIAVDDDGNACFSMRDIYAHLPITTNLSEAAGANPDEESGVCILKLNSFGNDIIFSTCLGDGTISSLCLDQEANIYFTGYASSTFPLTHLITDYTGDGFLIGKLASSGDELLRSTVIGPGMGKCIALDDSGNVFVSSSFSEQEMPVTETAIQSQPAGQKDLYLAELSSDLGDILLASYLGGSSADNLFGMDIFKGGIYLCGSTSSPDFPVTQSAYDTDFNGSEEGDGFFLKFNLDSLSLEFCSFTQELYRNAVYGIDVDENGVFLCGVYCAFNPADPVSILPENAFLRVFDLQGENQLNRWNFGRETIDYAIDVHLDDLGNAYLIGNTDALNFPHTRLDYGTYFDTFVVKIGGFGSVLPTSISIVAPNASDLIWQQGESVAIRWKTEGPVGDLVRIELMHLDTLKQIISPESPNDGYKTWIVSRRLPEGDHYYIRITSLLNPSIFKQSEPFSITQSNEDVTGMITTIPEISSKVVPIFDGKLDDALWHFLDTDTLGFGGLPGNYNLAWTDWNDNCVTWQAAWCPETNRLYVGVTVRDDVAGIEDNSIWNEPDKEDCIEFYTDGNYDGGDYWERFDLAQRWFVRRDNNCFLYNYPDLETYPDIYPLWLTGCRTMVSDSGNGNWTCEAVFEIYDSYPDQPRILVNGDRIGWDIWYNDSDNKAMDNGHYVIDRQTGWNYQGKAWRNADYFGTMILGDFIDIPYLALMTPDSTQSEIFKNQIVAITWESAATSGPEVQLALTQSDTLLETIADSVQNDGSYNWLVENDIRSGPDYRVRVISNVFKFVQTSSPPFHIQDQPILVLTIPGADTTRWQTTQTGDIQWLAEGTVGDKIKIDLLKNKTWWSAISDSTLNDGQFSWEIPMWISSGTYSVRISALSDTNIMAISRASVVIEQTPLIVIQTPKPSDSFQSDDMVTIEWEAYGDLGDWARIDLYSGNWYVMTLTDSTDMYSPFLWKITNTLEKGDNYRIQVGTIGGEIANFSEGPFSIAVTASQDAMTGLPLQHRLWPCHPNPFNPETLIRYDVATQAHVSIRIYNILGVQVAQLENSVLSPGQYHTVWKGVNDWGQSLGSGAYVVELTIGQWKQRMKVMLLR